MLGAGVGALTPLPAYRLSLPSGSGAGCPHCQVSLPVGFRGWLGRGTCVACRRPVTVPLWRCVVIGALVFVLLVMSLPHRHPAEILLLTAWLIFAGAGVLLAVIDIHVMRLPTKVLLPVAAVVGSLVVAAAVVSGDQALVRKAGTAAAVMGLAYLMLALLAPGKLGMGDAQMAAVSGLLLGTYGWAMVVLGTILAWLVGGVVAAALLRTGRVRREASIPFVPYLVAGTLLAVVAAGWS